jgi:two-component system, OmpR family, sensor histidine kinase BaeS
MTGPRTHGERQADRTISARTLVIGSFALVAAGMIILAGATLWSHRINAAYAARVDMAYAQALQVTRLELAAAALGRADEAGRKALAASAEAYLASIEEESRLLGEDAPDQAEERDRAQQLIAAIMAERASGNLAETRRLASAIAALEMREAAQARSRAEAAAARTRTLVIAAAAAVLLVPLGLLIGLERLLAAPLRALESASDQLAEARPGERLAPRGLHEIRKLTARFNAMAEAVEARVAQRTAELARANSDLAAVDQRRRLFLAKVSHELRTPVTAIRGEAEVALGHGTGVDDLHEALVQIRQSSLFLGRRLDDLMVLAKADDARLPLGEGVTDPFAAARRACEIAAAYARTGAVTIRAEALPPEGAKNALIAGDADRMQQAIAAVIDNAIKFSPPGAVVTVSGALEDGAAVVRITDQGPGVAADELSRIFDPYVQGQSGRALGGTGLGLSLARWIVEAYRGTISAERGKGLDEGAEGLCVTLRLPIAV